VSRLRELRLHGFKTFAEPTRFVFEPGVNAVIGPNGSGKSNMADAVRWVLGEQSNRSLRTRRADDVIFAGSQQRKPTGLAEVVMTLDNADGWLPIDFGEVTIGRRAYRSGEAEYIINGARVRLRDIVELLAAGQLGASSLVIVGQGTVDAALSLRPEERRQLFEEAAGVKNLQVRKNEGLGRLSRAEENLTRVNDLVSELRPQVRRLALQAEHQQEHDSLGRRARALVQEGHHRRERALREALGDARRREAAAESAAEMLRSEIAAGRDAIAGAESRYWEAEQAAREAAQTSEAAREALIRLESRNEAIVARIGDSEKRLASGRAELESLASDDRPDAAAAAGEKDASQAALDAAIEAAAEAERRWQRTVETLAAADAELVAAEEALAEARARDAEALAAEARLREAAAERAAKAGRIEHELLAIGPAREHAEAAVTEARSQADRGRREAETAAAALAEARAAGDASRRRADDARVRATATAERVAAAQAELDALVERTDLSGGMGARLVASGWRSLVDAVSAPEAAWPAVEAVIGGELSEAFLWRDADPGSATADASGTVRLLDGRRPPEPAERQRALVAVGARRTLAEWIGGEEIPGIFASVAVAPDLGALLAGWRDLPPGWSAVTAAGDLADGRGLVALRGRADPPGGRAAREMVRRRQIADELSSLEPVYNEAADAAAAAVAEAAASERLRATAQHILDTADAEARRLTAEATEAERGLERLLADAERLNVELAELGSGDAGGLDLETGDAGHLTDRESGEARITRAREQRDEAASSRETAREAWLTARQLADELERGALGSRRRIAELLVKRESLERGIGESERDLGVLAAERHVLDEQVAEARSKEQQSAARRSQADAQRERLRAELLGLERQESGASGQLAELDRAHQAAALEVTRHDDALAALTREREIALDALSLERSTDQDAAEAGVVASAPGADGTGLAAEVAALDGQELDAELRRIRRLLSQIGSVNPFAVEEHREHAARLDALSTQEADLRGAIGATHELISRLDMEINERFAVAFRAIGTAFDEFVQLLFAGGSASLEQVEGEEGDSSGGIEIVVRPPGKRPQRLAMLSGGERALTGVALLFAMLSVNPVPFCILDEVDAALDEANIGRFAAALRKLADRIDFVVITHNRATIEVADTIYGVTMTDAAVSRVVSLRLADLPVEASA
jgi:chromosome segregation protein